MLKSFGKEILVSFMVTILFWIFHSYVLLAVNSAASFLLTPLYHRYVDSQYRNAASGMVFHLDLIVIQGLVIVTLTSIPVFHSFGRIIQFYLLLPETSRESLFRRRLSATKVVWWKSSHIHVMLFSYIMALVLMVLGAAVYGSLAAAETYDQRLRALTPYLTDQEAKNLVGEWALVKSRRDYEAINHEFETLAKKYHAELPAAAI